MDTELAKQFLHLLTHNKLEHLDQAEWKILKDYQVALNDEMKEAVKKEIYGEGKTENGIRE